MLGTSLLSGGGAELFHSYSLKSKQRHKEKYVGNNVVIRETGKDNNGETTGKKVVVSPEGSKRAQHFQKLLFPIRHPHQ